MQPPRDEAVTRRLETTDTHLPSLTAERAPRDGTMPLGDEELNRAERVAARLGAWAGMLAVRYAPPMGPFFAADGRHANDGSLYLLEGGTETLVG